MNTNQDIPISARVHNFEQPKWLGIPIPEGEVREDIKPEDLTCFDCPQRAVCEWVDDHYNTNGGCLSMK